MQYLLAKNDLDGEKSETFYYVVSDDRSTFIKAIDMDCNEIGLPQAFHFLDINSEPPICAQP